MNASINSVQATICLTLNWVCLHSVGETTRLFWSLKVGHEVGQEPRGRSSHFGLQNLGERLGQTYVCKCVWGASQPSTTELAVRVGPTGLSGQSVTGTSESNLHLHRYEESCGGWNHLWKYFQCPTIGIPTWLPLAEVCLSWHWVISIVPILHSKQWRQEA